MRPFFPTLARWLPQAWANSFAFSNDRKGSFSLATSKLGKGNLRNEGASNPLIVVNARKAFD